MISQGKLMIGAVTILLMLSTLSMAGAGTQDTKTQLSQWPSPTTRLGYPQWVKYGLTNTHWITISNPEPDTLKITSIVPVKTAYPEQAWLSVSASSLTIPPAGSDSFAITITATPFFAADTDWWLNGRVVMHAPENAAESVDIEIADYVVTDTVVGVVYDTLVSCGVKLIVSNHGNMGAMGKGGVNLDFTGLTECNPEADVYLFDGGPIVIRKVATDYVYTSALYQPDLTTDQAWRPIAGPAAGHFSTSRYNGYFTGNMVNRDSSIGINIRYYAPTGGGDSCDFVIQGLKVFKMTPGTLTGVTVGQGIDWDIWSDSGTTNSYNKSGVSAEGFVYQRAVDTGAVTGCNPDSGRFGAQIALGISRYFDVTYDPCINHRIYGMYAQYNDSLFKYDTLSEALEGDWYWDEMAIPGLRSRAGVRDFHLVTTYVHNATASGIDTLYCWTALTTVRNGTLADLEANVASAREWYYNNLAIGCGPCPGCCSADVGNVDNDAFDGVDVGDLTALIDNLFINFTPLACIEEANCDGDSQSSIDVGDLTALIDYLFINFTPLPACGC